MPEFPQFHIPMDIQPSECCEYCEKKQWDFCIVDTSRRVDLFTGKTNKLWRGASICRGCGLTTYWKVDPDLPYEEVSNPEAGL